MLILNYFSPGTRRVPGEPNLLQHVCWRVDHFSQQSHHQVSNCRAVREAAVHISYPGKVSIPLTAYVWQLQSTLSKRTLSKPDTSLKRTANLVPAELHLYLCNWTLSKADTSLSWTADIFFPKFGSKTSQNGHRMLTQIYNRPENSAIWWQVRLWF